jgi:hypothetical protein
LGRSLVDFDVGSPRIGDERDPDPAVIHRVRPIELDVAGFERLDGCLPVEPIFACWPAIGYKRYQLAGLCESLGEVEFFRHAPSAAASVPQMLHGRGK